MFGLGFDDVWTRVICDVFGVCTCVWTRVRVFGLGFDVWTRAWRFDEGYNAWCLD